MNKNELKMFVEAEFNKLKDKTLTKREKHVKLITP